MSDARKRRTDKLPLMGKSIGVLYSGGLDSAALIGAFLSNGYDVWPVFIQCGLRWEKQEIYWAKKFLRAAANPRLHPLATAQLSLDEAYQKNWSHTGKTPGRASDDKDVFLPARNLLLVTKALLFLSSNKIYRLALATLSGNPFPDASRAYFRTLEKLLGQSFLKPVQILTPFRHLSKPDIIHRQKDWPIHLSLSCINPRGMLHCGRCNKCAERQRAFHLAGVKDRTTYIS